MMMRSRARATRTTTTTTEGEAAADGDRSGRRRVPISSFLIFNFLVAPVLVLLICVVLGALLAACEGWPFKDGYYLVAGSISGAAGFTNGSEDELTIIGEILEILISITALTLAGGVVGLASIMSLSSELPEMLNVNDRKNALVTLFVFIPVVVLVFCFLTGALFAAAEGWPLRDGFEYIVQTVCGLANPLTSAVPESDHAKTIALVFAVASLGITSVIVGIVGAMALCEETINALETQLERWGLIAVGVIGGAGGRAKRVVAPAASGEGGGGAVESQGNVTHTDVEEYTAAEAGRREGGRQNQGGRQEEEGGGGGGGGGESGAAPANPLKGHAPTTNPWALKEGEYDERVL